MPRRKTTQDVEVVPVAWLDVSDFAEVSDDKQQVFVSDGLELQSTSVKARLSRFIGNVTGELVIGDEKHLDLVF